MSLNVSRQRVLDALAHRRPDILPLYESYWPEFVEMWSAARGLPNADAEALQEHYGVDMLLAVPDESPWPRRAAVIEDDGQTCVSRTGWGAVRRTARGAFFAEALSAELDDRVDPDSLVFESPHQRARYEYSDDVVAQRRDRYAIFGKTGGPFLRTANLRGYEQFLVDIGEDPEWTRAIVERVMEHMTAVGVEQIRRNPDLVGMMIADDCCSLAGPVMSPAAYERAFLPSLRRMVSAYHEAGAGIVFKHCDGNPMPLVDMWVDAGVDAIHPCEPRAGVDIQALRARYGSRLAFIGAMDNCVILPRGQRAEIESHVRELAEFGAEGGLVMGGHSIGPDVSVESYDWAMDARRAYGDYAHRDPAMK